jgi:uncharacterized protein (TIGR00730 family)
MEKLLCVYSSSSDAVAADFVTAAAELGRAMVANGYGLVYGGTHVGLMGALARSVHQAGGKVVGIIPEALHGAGISYNLADELVVTKGMRERKAAMEERSDAFVALPGGFGTLEELFEILTLKQLRYHNKPVAILNVNGFYDPLLRLFEHIYAERFAKPHYRLLYEVVSSPSALFEYLAGYQPPELGVKW